MERAVVALLLTHAGTLVKHVLVSQYSVQLGVPLSEGSNTYYHVCMNYARNGGESWYQSRPTHVRPVCKGYVVKLSRVWFVVPYQFGRGSSKWYSGTLMSCSFRNERPTRSSHLQAGCPFETFLTLPLTVPSPYEKRGGRRFRLVQFRRTF